MRLFTRTTRMGAVPLMALAAMAAACGSGEPTIDVATGGLAAPTMTSLSPTTTVASTVAPTTSAAESQPAASDEENRFFAWYSLQQGEDFYAVPYLVDASPDFDALYADDEFLVDVPFGMSPEYGRLQIWSEGGGLASHPADPVVWPIECVGPSPDIDGDGLLDDCDPYPADGPLADWDGDGVLNPNDNCPTVANPNQERVGERHSGLACDTREGVHATEWLVPADVTLESWNELRSARGLEPIILPDGAVPLPAEVAAWCERGAPFDLDAPEEEIVAYLRDIPDAYGLDAPELEALIELTLRSRSLVQAFSEFESTEAVGLDPAEFAERLDAFQEERRAIDTEAVGLTAPMLSSDLACPR